MGKVIFGCLALAIIVFLIVLTCKHKSSDLFKWSGIAILAAILLTWIIPYGEISDAGVFVENDMLRIGFADLPQLVYYALNISLNAIVFILAVGGLYGILTKTESYSALVKKMSISVADHPILSSIVFSVLLMGLSSIFTNGLALLVIIPFIITVLLNAKFDKLTAMGVTFGSVLVGQLGATFGSEGLYWFNGYTGLESSTGLFCRLIISLCAMLLYIGFTIYKVSKRNTKLAKEDALTDTFAVEDVKASIIPAVIILSLLLVITILGFVDWKNYFGINCFADFHTWLTGLALDSEGKYTLISFILGNYAVEFGSFTLSTIVVFIVLAAFLAVLTDDLSFGDATKEFGKGTLKMFKPLALYISAYVIFIVAYMSPTMTYISSFAYGLTENFNPYLTTITSFITSIFHTDLGYTGFIIRPLFKTIFVDNIDLASTIYVATYGLVQLFIPTSGILLLGLGYSKLDYKKWFKHVWLYVVAFIVVFLIFITIA